MSNCVIPPLNIDPQDCVGDSLGKFNYNALALDTTFCNLSSLLYTNDINSQKVSNEMVSIMENYFFNIIPNITEKNKNDFLQATTTVNLLSSFWGQYEFSIQMPINSISLSANDVNILSIKLSSINNKQDVESLANNNLKPITEIHLNNTYKPVDYPEYTIVNVSFFLYNLVPIINQSSSIDPLIKFQYTPVNTFNYNNRLIYATYTRDNVYITTGIVLRFYVKDQKWNYMGYYLNDDNTTAQPNYNTLAIKQNPNVGLTSASETTNILGPCKTIKANTWYSIDEYIYANSLYTGTSTKLGSITLTLRTTDNKVSTFTYKANGYNPITNTGGTDVYMEIDNNIINAYEQNPIPKTLVQSWINPYREKNGVNFKYTAGNNGVSFTLCAATSII
jgi:hypothetical protein